MQIPGNTLKSRVQAGRPSFGMWLQSACPTIAEIAGLVGLDFVIIDQEHGPGDIQSAIDMMRALSGSPTTAVVRAPINDPAYLKRILDAGAQAVLVPMVDTAEQAKQLVDACLYPPRGRRGNAAVVVRSAGYGLVADYVQRAHETLLVVPQIETVTAVANARDIASVPGVDMVFIGPADLSGSAGVPDETGAPEVSRLIAAAESAVRAAGKPLATVPRVGKSWQDLFAEGYLAVAAISDLAMLRQGVVEAAEAWRRHQGTGDAGTAPQPPGRSGPYS